MFNNDQTSVYTEERRAQLRDVADELVEETKDDTHLLYHFQTFKWFLQICCIVLHETAIKN